MFIYAGRSYSAVQQSSQLVEVCCDRCATKYAYELVRAGEGREEAPFFLGGQRAAQSAGQQAAQNARKRLETEAELVPCPRCHWINESLVVGYRRTRCKILSHLAFRVAFFGTVISLLIGQFNAGPMADVEWYFWFLKAPLYALGIASGLLVLQWGLRQRIRPNRLFPDPPVVPKGTPIALILDSDGYLVPRPEIGSDEGTSHWVTFQAGRFSFPEQCCECLEPTRSTYAPSGISERIEVKLCSQCHERLTWRLWKAGILFCAITIPIAIGILALLPMDRDFFWIFAVTVSVVILLASKFVAHYHASPALTKTTDAARGVFSVWFRNPDYARLCREISGR